jgi:hypothetical protein
MKKQTLTEDQITTSTTTYTSTRMEYIEPQSNQITMNQSLTDEQDPPVDFEPTVASDSGN